MIKENFHKVEEKMNALTLRERGILFAVAMLAVVALFYLLWLEPLILEKQRTSRQINTLTTKVSQQKAEVAVLQAQLQVGVHAELSKQKQTLVQELAALEQQLNEAVVALIPPKVMPEVLETLLVQETKLTLVGLENKPVEPVMLAKNDTEKTENQFDQEGLYKHSFVITLRGSYNETLSYFKKLEALPWRFYWDSLNYQVEEYPNALITLEVHTVSTAKEWIGV